MIDVRPLRELSVDPHSHPRGQAFLSAASGLVRAGQRWYVLADDEHHLGSFDAGSTAPGQWIRVLEGELPKGPKRRKAQKPDLEALAALPEMRGSPHGALLALGSGSRPNRCLGVLLTLDEAGQVQPAMRHIDLTPLYAPLQVRFAKLNIEGALMLGGDFMLLQRGNKGERTNASIRYEWRALRAWLLDASVALPAPRVQCHELGEVDGVPFSFTDGAALADGAWAFTAVAEDTDDNYADGACLGAAIGVIDADGALCGIEALARTHKVEGIALHPDAGPRDLALVTDADDPDIPASLLSARLPQALYRAG